MRVMYLVKSNHPGPPSPELMQAMEKLAQREIKVGRMLDNGGLLPISAGAQIRIADNKLSLVDGPFIEAKELMGGWSLINVKSLDEAIRLVKRSRDIVGAEGITELCPVMFPEDFAAAAAGQ